MEGVFFILIFVGVIAITALLFGVWIIVAIARVITRIIGSMLALPKVPPMPPTHLVRAGHTIRCTNDRCNGQNPAAARFCRRCGTALDAAQRVRATRRAVAWCCW